MNDDLDINGFIRLPSIIAPNGPIPISRSTFYAYIKQGKLPPPIKFGRTSAWSKRSIAEVIERANRGEF